MILFLKKCLQNLIQKNEMQSGAGLARHPSWTAARSRNTKEIIACMAISVTDTRHPLKLLYSKDSRFQPPCTCLRSQVRRLARIGSLNFHLQPPARHSSWVWIFPLCWEKSIDPPLGLGLVIFPAFFGTLLVILDYSSLPTLSISLTSILGSHLS